MQESQQEEIDLLSKKVWKKGKMFKRNKDWCLRLCVI